MERSNISTIVMDEVLSDDTTRMILKILMLGVTPAVSFFGLVGNAFSIAVLTRQGLRKCSNILLVSLAVADITFLVSFNSIPKILYQAVWDDEYPGYSKEDTESLFLAFSVFNVLDYSLQLTGMSFPLLITIERLVVIFCPLNFRRIITPGRTWLAVAGVALYCLSIFIYSSFWLEIRYEVSPKRNISFGTIQQSHIFKENPDVVSAVADLAVSTTMIIPPVSTFIGCVIISIKIRITSIRRKKMTLSKRQSGSRTTRTLLAVCAVYTVTSVVYTLPLYIPQYASYSLTDESPSNAGKLFYQLVNIVGCINSSSNFVVYIVMNQNFRDTYMSLFKTKCCHTSLMLA